MNLKNKVFFFYDNIKMLILKNKISETAIMEVEIYEWKKKKFESSDTLPMIEIRGFHCLGGLNKIYPGFLLIPLNLATSTS